MVMELLKEFINCKQPASSDGKQQSFKNNPLKVLSKKLVKAVKEARRGEQLLMSEEVVRLVPTDVVEITSLTLDKLVLIWEQLHPLRTEKLKYSILNMIASFLRESPQELSYGHGVKLQRCLRLLMVLCHPSEKFSDEFVKLLRNLKPLIAAIVSSGESASAELCSLAGTVWCSLVHTSSSDLMEQYLLLYSDLGVELRLGHVAITSGVVNIAKVVPREELNVNSQLIKDNILQQCRSGVKDYHSFSCLQKYLQSSMFVQVLEESPDTVQQELTDLLWAHCDSSVDGVGDFVLTCFKTLLTVSNKHLDMPVPLHDVLLDRILPMPWNVKAKLKLLTVLMPWICPLKLLEKQPGLVKELSQCLSAQYLASVAGKLYTSLIHRLTFDNWRQVVMEQFIAALTSPVSLIRYNARQYWLPATLTQYSNAQESLLQELSSQHIYMPALISVCRTCRKLSSLKKLPIDVMHQALMSSNDEMRADVFSLVCVSSSPADTPSEDEMKLLEKYLPYNVNIDSPTFRNQLLSALSSWMTRLSHSLTNQVTDSDSLIRSHLHFLWTLCTNSLLQSSNYQRKETLLKLSTLLLHTFSAVCTSERVASLVHGCICREERCSNENGCLTLSGYQQTVVNRCILDSSAEIQDLGFKFLTLPIVGHLRPVSGWLTDYLLSNLPLWKGYITSPKATEAESGAYIYTLIHNECADRMFVQNKIIDLLELTVSSVEKDHSLIATTSHVYGYLVSLRRILHTTGYLKSLLSEELSSLSTQLVTICQRIVIIVLEVLMSTCSNKEVSPSFEQMEEAMLQLVHGAKAKGSLSADEAVQDVTERVSAWCWLSLKEACCLCGALTQSSLHHPQLMSLSSALSIKEMFYTTLTKCRHRGVIEGTSSALVQFCQVMLRNDLPTFRNIPANIICQVLDTTVREDKVVSNCYVTRRSGGYPIIVQSVLVAESKSKQSQLMNLVVGELLRSCDQLPTEQLDEKTDMPQVHSLNILKALVVDAKLTSAIRCSLASITILCIDGFNSPVWAVRNACMQLFACCTERLIGQKRQSDGSVISTSSGELFSQFPSLYQFMLDKLRACQPDRLNMAVFPVLSLLSSLSPFVLASQSRSPMCAYREVLMSYMSSPVHATRRLACQAIVATVESVPEMCSMLVEFSQAIFKETKANCLHSQLLVVYQMVRQLTGRSGRDAKDTLTFLTQQLISSSVSFLSGSKCDVICAAYLDIILLLCDSTQLTSESLRQWLISTLALPTSQEPGGASLNLTCARLLCLLADLDTMLLLITSDVDIEVKLLFIDYVGSQHLSVNLCTRLQETVCDELLATNSYYYTHKLMESLLASLLSNGVHVSHEKLSPLTDVLDNTSADYLMLSVYLHTSVARDDLLSQLYMACQPANNEELRSLACKCLSVIVKSWKEYLLSEADIMQLLSCLLVLLQDESSEVRVDASRCTALLISVSNRSDSASNQPDSASNQPDSASNQSDSASNQPDSASNQPDSAPDIHYSIAIYKVLRELPEKLGVGGEAWTRWLQGMMKDHLTHYLSLHASARGRRMFFQDEDNVYSERGNVSKAICSVLAETKRYTLTVKAIDMELQGDDYQLHTLVFAYNDIRNVYNTLCLELSSL